VIVCTGKFTTKWSKFRKHKLGLIEVNMRSSEKGNKKGEPVQEGQRLFCKTPAGDGPKAGNKMRNEGATEYFFIAEEVKNLKERF